MPKKLTTKEFIERAITVHDDAYGYEKVEYLGSNTKVTITCPIHDDFEQTPDHHLSGQGCPQCGIEKSADIRRGTAEQFINNAKQVHDDAYGYEKVKYLGNNTKVTITCPIHEKFEQTPNGHLNGNGCPHCRNVKIGDSKRGTTEQFINDARTVHGNLYDYDNVEYVNNNTPVNITCKVHGDYEQRPTKHIHRAQGCPQCTGSKMEKAAAKCLDEIQQPYIAQARLPGISRLSFDFALLFPNGVGVLVECDGQHHFEPVCFGGISQERAEANFKTQLIRDKEKNDFIEGCKNVSLVRIPYWDADDVADIIEDIIENNS